MNKWIVTFLLAVFSLSSTHAHELSSAASTDEVADTIAFKANGPMSFLISPDFEIKVSDGERTQVIKGKGFEKKDAIQCKFPATKEQTVTITGPVRNLLFTPITGGSISYKYHLSMPEGKSETVAIFVDGLSQLDISRCQSVRDVLCRGHKLTALDVSHNPGLEQLDCSANRLTSLDVSRNTNLQILMCTDNQLKEIDVSHNPELKELICFDASIPSLDVSANKKLEFLSCGSLIEELDVSHNTELITLICRAKLTKLDLSPNKKLRKLHIDSNLFSVEGLNALFKTLPVISYYDDNPELDFSENPGTSDCNLSLLREKGWMAPKQDM